MDSLVTQMIDTSSEVLKERATTVVTDREVLADKLSKVVSCIDVSRIARAVGDAGSAESALDQVRVLALQLLGLKE